MDIGVHGACSEGAQRLVEVVRSIEVENATALIQLMEGKIVKGHHTRLRAAVLIHVLVRKSLYSSSFCSLFFFGLISITISTTFNR